MGKKHIVDGQIWSAATERAEVFALCGYSEEASGSGRHTVDKGDAPCERCETLAKRQRLYDAEEELAERCYTTHEAIRGGRTRLASIGIQPSPRGDLALYDCPLCGSTISRRLP